MQKKMFIEEQHATPTHFAIQSAIFMIVLLITITIKSEGMQWTVTGLKSLCHVLMCSAGIKEDAVNIYSRYIALDCQSSIGINEELRNSTISKLTFVLIM